MSPHRHLQRRFVGILRVGQHPWAASPSPVGCHAFTVTVEPRHPARRAVLPRGHTAPAAGPRSADQGRRPRGEASRGQAAPEVPGGRPSPARNWRSSSEAAWFETPGRARSASRVIGCPWAPWCSAAARLAAVRSASSPPSCAWSSAPGSGDGRPGADGSPVPSSSAAGQGRCAARSPRPRPRSGPSRSAGPGRSAVSFSGTPPMSTTVGCDSLRAAMPACCRAACL
jgi:hypothetical protein